MSETHKKMLVHCNHDVNDNGRINFKPGEAMILPAGHKLRYAHEWQPIESAPKDGTHVIALVPLSMVEGIEQQKPAITEMWFNKKPYHGKPRWEPIWLSIHGCGCCGGDEPQPTHWMPLPSPPKESN